MRDLHCHILPCVDDGAESEADALAMARLAVEEGIRDIVVTPHFHMLDRESPRDDLTRRVGEFQALLLAEGVPLTIHAGCEVYLEPDTPKRWDDGELTPINGSSFLLVETSFHDYPRYVDDVLFQLQTRGVQPILAHPERYVAFQQKPELLADLVGRGVLAQLTAGSLLGYFGKGAKSAADTFMKRGLVQIVSTDAHRPAGNRSTAVNAARARALELVGEARATAMFEDLPAAILRDETIDLPPVEAPAGGSFFRRLWPVGARS
jgi:protein-tyrosine phosphatase